MSIEPLYKVCPECATEYLPTATRCSDCNVDLVHQEELAKRRRELESFPPASQLTCVRVAPIAWVRALSETLQEHDIAHRVEPAQPSDAPEGQQTDAFGDVDLFGLYVKAEKAAAAREIDGAVLSQLLPEESAPLADGEEESCPACGAALTMEAAECPDCGLGFGA